jgi:hypothetical protein
LKFLNIMVIKNFISNDSTIAYGTQRRSKKITLNFRIFKRFHDYQKCYESIEMTQNVTSLNINIEHVHLAHE